MYADCSEAPNGETPSGIPGCSGQELSSKGEMLPADQPVT
jgi:hypothetical protein